MPTMWFVKDGYRPHSQIGPGTSISFGEVAAIFGSHQMQYVGREGPSINSDKPSHSNKNVVLEVEEREGSTPLLPEQGFYYIVGCLPISAEHDLLALRDSA